MTQTDDIYTFGPFRLDVTTRTLTRDGEAVTLTAKAFDTLVVLLRYRDQVVDKEQLVRLVWPDTYVSDDSLTHSVSVLRRVLGDDSAQPVYIATIPRRGYRFTAPVHVEVVPRVEARADADGEVTVANAHPDLPALLAARLGESSGTRGRRAWQVSLLILVPVAAIPLAIRLLEGAPSGAPVSTIRFVQDAPPAQVLASGAVVSPDGRYLAFVARRRDNGRSQLWVRSLDSPQARVLPGTEGAFRPFWAPNSQTLGFFAEGRLKRVGLGNQPPQTLAEVGYRPSGGSWSSSGVILFADRQSRLFAVTETGGEKTAVTSLEDGRDVAHQAPFFLPDSREFLYYVFGSSAETSGTYLGSLDSDERVRLLDSSSSSVSFAEPGYLLFVRDGNVMAQRFDRERRRITGAPQPIASTRTEAMVEIRAGVISASTNGILTFGGDAATEQLTWFTRDGRHAGTIQSPSPLHNPAISPDGRYVAADGSGSDMSIWLVDLARGTPTRFGDGVLPVWGPRGADIVFTSRRIGGSSDLVHRSIAGASTDESLLLRSPEMKIGGNWTGDNRYIVYTGSDPKTKLDLWTLSVADRKPVPFLQTSFNEMHGQVSPDGRWLAYASDESGTWEVYVQTFPEPGAKRTISIGGGAEPQWRRDGRELYYLAPEGTLMAVAVSSTHDVFDAGRAVPLFQARIPADILAFRNHYAPSHDGQRFLVDAADDNEPINVVVNWTALLQAR
jgi:DNA-binding winged helix-turn-helix (wHTH) protein/Tol biopolymer transport system component